MAAPEFVTKREEIDAMEREVAGLLAARKFDDAKGRIADAQEAVAHLTELADDHPIQQRVVENREGMVARLEQGLEKAKKKTKRTKRKKSVPRWTHEQAIEHFFTKFPAGFEDPGYAEQELGYKREAHEKFADKLGAGQGASLLAEGNLPEIVSRYAYVFFSSKGTPYQLNLLSPYEAAALKEALADTEAATRYFQALFALLDGGEVTEPAYAELIEAVKALPAAKGRVATWPVLTQAPYIAQPEKHILLKPEVTKAAAARFDFDLAYTAKLNWATYAKLLDLAGTLLAKLQEHGAKDFIDVQSFIWVTGSFRGDVDGSV